MRKNIILAIITTLTLALYPAQQAKAAWFVHMPEQEQGISTLSTNEDDSESDSELTDDIDVINNATEIIVNANDVAGTDRKRIKQIIGDYAILEYDNAGKKNEAYTSYMYQDAEVYMPRMYHINDTGEAGYRGLSWGYDNINAKSFNEILLAKYGSIDAMPEIKVAVIDTGVDYNHGFLKGRVADYSHDYVDNDDDAMDDNEHGTHVAGIIADTTLPNVKIYAYKVLDATGRGSDTDIAAAIVQAAADGVDVINMSLGGSGNSAIMEAAMDKAIAANIVIVVAAGNDNDDAIKYHPANYSDALTVAAVDRSNRKAYFSNYGRMIDVAAPGVDINSSVPNNGYEEFDGTSMASPFVAGAVASLKTYLYEKNYNNEDLSYILKMNAKDIGDTGVDDTFGYGLIDMDKLGKTISSDEWEWQGVTLAPKITSKKIDDTVYEVSISCSEDTAEIFYTLDGSRPAVGVNRYEGPFTVSSSTLISAIAKAEGKNESDQTNEKIYIGEDVIESDFTIDSDGTLTGYNGDQEVLRIPTSIRNIAVKKLGSYFLRETSVKELYISDSVTEISYFAFQAVRLNYVYIGRNVSKIGIAAFDSNQKIEIDPENQYFRIEDGALYTRDYKYLITICKTDAKEIHINQDCEYVLNAAFGNIEEKKIYVPASLKDINHREEDQGWSVGHETFNEYIVDNDNLYYSSENSALYNKEKTIIYSFYHYDTNEVLELPATITEIGYAAFMNNTALVKIVFPSGLIKIDEFAFRYTDIQRYDIPDTVKYIENNCISSRYAGKAIELYFDGNAPEMGAYSVSGKYIHIYRYSWAKGFERVYRVLSQYREVEMFYRDEGNDEKNPEDYFEVTDEGRLVAYNGLETTVHIPEAVGGKKVTTIGKNFLTDDFISELYIPDTVETIENEALSSHKLEKIHIGKNVSTIGMEAFYDSVNLKEIIIDSENKNIYLENNILYANEYLITAILNKQNECTVSEKCKYILKGAFHGSSVIKINIPASVINVDRIIYIEPDSKTPSYSNYRLNNHEYYVDNNNRYYSSENGDLYNKEKTVLFSHYEYSDVEYITLPDTVKDIESYAFWDCNSLKRITLSDKLETIGFLTFYKTSIHEYILPSTIRYWGYRCFDSNSTVTLRFCGDVRAGGRYFDINGRNPIIIYKHKDAKGFDEFISQVSQYSEVIVYDIEDEEIEESTEIQITIPSGYDTSKICIDGIDYSTTYNSDTKKYVVDPERNDLSTISAFKLNASGSPIGMYVWTLDYANGKYEVTPHPELENLLNYKGFSVRVKGISGIRYKADILTDTKKKLASSNGYYGYKLKEYGVIAIQASAMKKLPFIIGGEKVKGTIDYKVDENGKVTETLFERKDGYDSFTGLLTGIPASGYNTNIAFRSYIILEKNGKAYTFYQMPVSRSIYYLAKQYLDRNMYKEGTEEYLYLKDIIDAVER